MAGSNPAQRVLRCLSQVHNRNDKPNYADALLQITGPASVPGRDPFREAALRQEAIQRQLDKAEKSLKAEGFPTDLYSEQFARVRQAFSPHMVASAWTQAQGLISPEVVLVVKWVAFALPDDGLGVESEAAAQFIASVDALLDDELLASLPATVRESLQHALEALLTAARTGPIDGVEPVAQALRVVVEEVEASREVVGDIVATSPQGRGFAQKLRTVVDSFRAMAPKVADGLAKTGERLDKIGKIADRAQQLVTYVAQVIDRLPSP